MKVASSHKFHYGIAKHKEQDHYLVCFQVIGNEKWSTLDTKHPKIDDATVRILELIEADNREVGIDYEMVNLSGERS